jgi:hypothetical protein
MIDRTTVATVNRDNGDTALESDWFDICGLSVYSSASVPFIGLFIDQSGSMTLRTVQASYNKFVVDMTAAGLSFREVTNANENWILPFLTDLAPPAAGAELANVETVEDEAKPVAARHQPVGTDFAYP